MTKTTAKKNRTSVLKIYRSFPFQMFLAYKNIAETSSQHRAYTILTHTYFLSYAIVLPEFEALREFVYVKSSTKSLISSRLNIKDVLCG